jgi:hypothetical protein
MSVILSAMRLAVLACAALTSAACARGTSDGPPADVDASEPDAARAIDAPLPEPDASMSDAPTPDAGSIDASMADASMADASMADASMADASMADASTTDASTTDASTTDASTLCAHPTSGTLLTFDFTGQPGNQASTSPSSSAAGITGGAIARAAALTAVSGNNSINASNWGQGSAPDGTRYFTFTVTPDPTCVLDLTTLTVDTKSSTTGPSSGAVATSADAFASTKTFTTNGTSPVALSVTGAAGAIEVRVYGFAAGSTGGTMRIQGTLTLAGALR